MSLSVVPAFTFLANGGETGALMRAHDWSRSPLGHPESWPQSLRSMVGMLLNSKFPMFVAWGPELGFLYNDAYAEILGAKHPAALGRHSEDKERTRAAGFDHHLVKPAQPADVLSLLSRTETLRLRDGLADFLGRFYRSSGTPPPTAPWRCSCRHASFNRFLVNPNPLLHRMTCPSHAS